MDMRLANAFTGSFSPFGSRFRSDLEAIRDAVAALSDESAARRAEADSAKRTERVPYPTRIVAKITGSTGPFVGPLGADYYKYQWTEVYWSAGGPTWPGPTGPRTHTAFQTAVNIVEASSTSNRVPIPSNRVVEIVVEPDGFVWFADGSAELSNYPYPAIIVSSTTLVANTRWSYSIAEATVNTGTGVWSVLPSGRSGTAYNGAENNADGPTGLIGVGQDRGPTSSVTRNPIKTLTVVDVALDANGVLYFSMPNGYSFVCDGALTEVMLDGGSYTGTA